jgi:processive 1,2-diacylglycerol beta-glucosyltransferase
MPRILIISASIGGGHVRAAQAVELGLRQQCPSALVRNVDMLSMASGLFRRIYNKGYFDLVAKAPHLVSYLYDKLDRPTLPASRHMGGLGLAFRKASLRPLVDLLRYEPWDIVVHTHFLSSELLWEMRRRRHVDLRQMTVTTDFDPHRLWVTDPADHYFVACEEAAASVAAMGVAPANITISGIPIHPVFGQAKDPRECRRRQGLPLDRPVVLLLASGLSGPVAEGIFRGLLQVEAPLHVVAVSGRTPRLRDRLAAVPLPPRHRATVLGFTDQMDELMAAADLGITKPGGLTSSECLARGMPTVIVDPIPGQETRNADHLLEHGASVKASSPPVLAYKVGLLLGDRSRLDRMRAAARSMARPGAAEEIAKVVLGSIR